jgi:exopolyphosphatase/pppGpp-phosphohydrolase
MGCIYIIDGIEYNEDQLKDYLAKNLESFSKELAGEKSEYAGINKAANQIRREMLGMQSYDPDVVTNIEANKRAEEWLKAGGDVNKLLSDIESKSVPPLLNKKL